MGMFEVFHREYMGDDSKSFKAFDAEAAARDYAEHYDTGGDYSLLNGDTIEIEVVGPGGEKTKFRCSGETVPSYSAKEIP